MERGPSDLHMDWSISHKKWERDRRIVLYTAPMNARISFVTFGCKTNWADSLRIMKALPSQLWQVVDVDELPDVVVFNSCTVTAKAERDLMKALRKARAGREDTRIILTGCMVEAYRERVEAQVDGVEIYGLSERARLLTSLGADDADPDWPTLESLDARPRTRAFLKVQEGCDYTCSYCIVPTARGASRSLSGQRVEALVEGAARRGLGELVLSGIHLGLYGQDRPEREGLPELLDRLGALRERLARERGAALRFPRIRLSSIEPNEVDEALIGAIARHDFVARHLHIPLQSGDAGILAAMRRRYRPERFAEAVEAVASALSPVGIGADVLLGFPGEDDGAFEATRRLLDGLPVTYLHAFSFSPRPGTDAAEMRPQVDPRKVKERVAVLRRLSQEKRDAFAASLRGAEVDLLVEGRGRHGKLEGYTDTYCRARTGGEDGMTGKLVVGRVEHADNGVLELVQCRERQVGGDKAEE